MTRPLNTSPYRSTGPRLTRDSPSRPSKTSATYVAIVETANTSAMIANCRTPYLEAAKNAGMPSIIGDDPRININAIRDDCGACS